MLVFVTAQPDVPYFHWQCKLYTYNFIKLGINPNQIHIIFSTLNGNPPSDVAKSLSKTGINVHFYEDNRLDKSYIPSIKPYLIHKWLVDNPEFEKCFFLHDADIIFRELPNFDELINDNTSYLSNTISYIGYNYIISCCRNYEMKYPQLQKGELVKQMTNLVGVDIDTIIKNENKSGGGQYLLKNTTSKMWNKIYEDCTTLYNKMREFHLKYPINGGEIQFWTAEMWSLIWNLWYFNIDTEISNELDFSWATDNISMYESKKILHMAGVTKDLKRKMFYKGDYINSSPIDIVRKYPNKFRYVESDNSTIKYIELIKDFILNNPN